MRSTRSSIDIILEHVSEYDGVPIDSLRMVNRHSKTPSRPRVVAMHLCQNDGGIRSAKSKSLSAMGALVALPTLFRLRRKLGEVESMQRIIASQTHLG